MELYSRRPVETESPLLPRRSRMSLGAVLSAIAVGTGATALMFWIQLDYPLVTGGMPIVSGWATAVVTFETTMAGAVFGIFFMLLKEAGLIGSRRRAPVPAFPGRGRDLASRMRTRSFLDEDASGRYRCDENRSGRNNRLTGASLPTCSLGRLSGGAQCLLAPVPIERSGL